MEAAIATLHTCGLDDDQTRAFLKESGVTKVADFGSANPADLVEVLRDIGVKKLKAGAIANDLRASALADAAAGGTTRMEHAALLHLLQNSNRYRFRSTKRRRSSKEKISRVMCSPPRPPRPPRRRRS